MARTIIDGANDGRSAVRTYAAYGLDTHGLAALSGYTGQVLEDAIDVYLLGSRPYLASLRRFAAADRLSPFDAGGINRYAYCSDDPVNRVDPTGGASTSLLGILRRRVAEAAWDVRRRGSDPDAIAATRGPARPTFAARIRHAVSTVLSWGDGVNRRITRTVANVNTRIRGYPGAQSMTATHASGTQVQMRIGRGWKTFIRRRTELALTDDLPEIDFEPDWRVKRNAHGVPIHLPDAAVTAVHTFKAVTSYMAQASARGQPVAASDVVVLAGGHGSMKGMNWTSEGTWETPAEISDMYHQMQDLIAEGHAELRGIQFQNITQLTKAQYVQFLQGHQTVFGGICYLLADEVTMEALGYKSATVYAMSI